MVSNEFSSAFASRANPEPLDTDQMAREFLMQFGNMVLTKEQLLVFDFQQSKRGNNDQQPVNYTIYLIIKRMEGQNLNSPPEEVFNL